MKQTSDSLIAFIYLYNCYSVEFGEKHKCQV